jgi:hypothetical protein
MLFLLAAALELGCWQVEQVFHGPFPIQPGFKGTGNHDHFYVPIGQQIPLKSVLSARADRENNGSQSDLRLRVNEDDWGYVRRSNSRVFTHWQDRLYFELSSDIPNDQTTIVVATYSIRLHGWIWKMAVFTTELLLVLLFTLAYRTGRIQAVLDKWKGKITARQTRNILAIFPALSLLVIAICVLYLVAIVFGFFAGDALPTTTAFRIFPAAGSMLLPWEPLMPIGLLLFSSVGTAASWLGKAAILNCHAVRRNEIALLRLWSHFGLVIVPCLLLFSLSAGGWSGHFRMVDANYFSMVSLVPVSDAFDYLESFYNNAIGRDWGLLGARRPMAQALRDALMVTSDYSFVAAVTLQTLFVSIALYFSARSLARWRGIWTAVAFVGLVWMIARPFLPTTLTEPLALIIALAFVPYLLEALRSRSLANALVALTGLTVALMVRMGNLFLIPFMVVWLPIAFVVTLRDRLRVVLVACTCVAAVVLVSAALSYLYSPRGGTTAGNFAWTLCGLSVGGNWGNCWNTYFADIARQNPGDEGRIALAVFAKTLQNIAENPSVLIASLYRNTVNFVTGLPVFFLDGYIPIHSPFQFRLSSTVGWLLASVLIPGFFIAGKRMSGVERSFWIGLSTTTFLSAMIILSDDGWRVLHVTNALLACLIAFGFVTPAVVTTAGALRQALSWKSGAASLAAVMGLALVAPALGQVLTLRELKSHPTPRSSGDLSVVFAQRFMLGFLVVPDNNLRPPAVPTLPLSQFTELFTKVQFTEDPGPLLARAKARAPFAFIASPISSYAGSSSGTYYIAPPEVLDRPDVRAWRLGLSKPIPKIGPAISIQEAISAEALK